MDVNEHERLSRFTLRGIGWPWPMKVISETSRTYYI